MGERDADIRHGIADALPGFWAASQLRIAVIPEERQAKAQTEDEQTNVAIAVHVCITTVVERSFQTDWLMTRVSVDPGCSRHVLGDRGGPGERWAVPVAVLRVTHVERDGVDRAVHHESGGRGLADEGARPHVRSVEQAGFGDLDRAREAGAGERELHRGSLGLDAGSD